MHLRDCREGDVVMWFFCGGRPRLSRLQKKQKAIIERVLPSRVRIRVLDTGLLKVVDPDSLEKLKE